jgi:hypothetical protein
MDKAAWRRLGFFAENQVRAHPFFRGVDWAKVLERAYDPPVHPCKPPRDSAAAAASAKERGLPPGSVLGLKNFSRSDREVWGIFMFFSCVFVFLFFNLA